MKVYLRSVVHAFYVLVALSITALADPAVRSFVTDHWGAAAALPAIVALLRIIETAKTGK